MHPSRLFALVSAVAALWLSPGCIERSHSESFEGASVPAGWDVYQGTWTVANASSAGRVLSARGAAEPGLSSFVNQDFGSVTSFDLQVTMGLLSGSDPQGVGIVFNWRDAGNYTIIRYSTHEHGWHLFTVINGERTKQEPATLPGGTDPGFNVWMALHVVQETGRVTAYDGSTKVIEHELSEEESQKGRIGLFVRGNSRAYFDDFTVTGS